MLINVKMATIIGILTFISMIFIFQHFSLYEQLKVCAQLSWAWKKFYNLGARQLDSLTEYCKTLIYAVKTQIPKIWDFEIQF